MKTYNFNSIEALIGAIDTEQGKGTRGALNIFINGRSDSNWMGGIGSMEDYLNTLKSGYLPAVESLQNYSHVNEGNTFNLVASNCGQFNDVATYLQGNPYCMADFESIEANQYKTINISVSTPYTTSSSSLMKKCEAVYSAINSLEVQNVRCKIYITATVQNGSQKFAVKVLIKDFSDNFISSYHGLLIGHLATVRGLIYAYMSIHSTSHSIGSRIPTEAESGEILVDFIDHSDKQITNIILNQ